MRGIDQFPAGASGEAAMPGADAERRSHAASAVAGMGVSRGGPVVGEAWGSKGRVTSVSGEGENQVVVGYEFDPDLNFARHAEPEEYVTTRDISGEVVV